MLIKDYHIGKQFYADTIGRLFIASTSDLDKTVLFNILYEDFAQNEELVLAFHTAAQTSSSIANDFFIPVVKHGQEQLKHFLIYENFDLIPLETLLARQSPFSLLDSTTFIEKLASALRTAHIEGTFHGFLTPQSIFVSEKLDKIKIANFGFDRFAQLLVQKRHTKILPVLPYLSSELLNGKKLTRQSDVFSLGVLFYRLLVGSVPNKERNLENYQQTDQTIVPPSLHRLEIPEFLDDLILNAIEPNPQNRTQNLSQFIKNLIEAKSDILATFTPTTQIVIDHLQTEQTKIANSKEATTVQNTTETTAEETTNIVSNLDLSEAPQHDAKTESQNQTTIVTNKQFTEVPLEKSDQTAYIPTHDPVNDAETADAQPKTEEDTDDKGKSDVENTIQLDNQALSETTRILSNIQDDLNSGAFSDLTTPESSESGFSAIQESPPPTIDVPLKDAPSADDEPAIVLPAETEENAVTRPEDTSTVYSIQLLEFDIAVDPVNIKAQNSATISAIKQGNTLNSQRTNTVLAKGEKNHHKADQLWSDLKGLQKRSKKNLMTENPDLIIHKNGAAKFGQNHINKNGSLSKHKKQKLQTKSLSVLYNLFSTTKNHEDFLDEPPLNLYPSGYKSKTFAPIIRTVLLTLIAILPLYLLAALVFDLRVPSQLQKYKQSSVFQNIRSTLSSVYATQTDDSNKLPWELNDASKTVKQPARDNFNNTPTSNSDEPKKFASKNAPSFIDTTPPKTGGNLATPERKLLTREKSNPKTTSGTQNRNVQLTLSVHSDGLPETANVYVNGTFYGKSNSLGKLTIPGLKQNTTYLITVEKSGFGVFARRIDLTHSKTRLLDVSLLPLVTPKTAAKTKRPPKTTTPVPSARRLSQKPPPKRLKSGLEKPDSKQNLPQADGIIDVQISSPQNLSDVYIYVNGNVWTGENYIAPAKLNLPEGSYRIEVKKEGYVSAPLSYSIDLMKGDTKRVTFILLPN